VAQVPKIHPTALVDAAASLDSSVEVGPFSIIGAGVEIGPGTVVGSHCMLEGPTRIGANNTIGGYCNLGGAPQDKKYDGAPTRLEIGDGNTIREYCHFNRGTTQDTGVTRIGHRNWIMAYVHVAHDCQVGNDTIFPNCATIAGHVHVGDFAIFGAFTIVHQFVHVGAHAITAMGTVLLNDLPPYTVAGGNPAKPYSINLEGLKRRGFTSERIADVKAGYNMLYRQGLSLADAKAALAEAAQTKPDIQLYCDFLAVAKRGIVR
jgi:UDP-N-acetylglucosamine acyltransferase